MLVFNKSPNSNRVCLFSHFDLECHIDPVVVHYLNSLKKVGLDIVVITTSPGLLERSIETVKDICHAIIHRENIGMDFGSWQYAIRTLDLSHYDEILLANDSVFGPFRPLDNLFARIDESKCSLLGLTQSLQFAYHFQSYFLYFKKEVFKSEDFKDFWKQDIPIKKEDIIFKFELRIVEYFTSRGYTAEPLYPLDPVRQKFLTSYATPNDFISTQVKRDTTWANPTVDRWEVLLRDFEFPFLKRELLTKNPGNYPNVSPWQDCLKGNEEIIGMIKNYLTSRNIAIL